MNNPYELRHCAHKPASYSVHGARVKWQTGNVCTLRWLGIMRCDVHIVCGGGQLHTINIKFANQFERVIGLDFDRMHRYCGRMYWTLYICHARSVYFWTDTTLGLRSIDYYIIVYPNGMNAIDMPCHVSCIFFYFQIPINSIR